MTFLEGLKNNMKNKYKSFTRCVDSYTDIDKFIVDKSTYYDDYDLFDFKIVYKGASATWPYMVTVVLKKIESK